ncbi:hypothetical protein TPENAI_10313 [Tenacibaculum litopenaei]|jgi:hypothetical protein|uniref:hypothetical protein n=1 Tax=Tenacibaculum litopenaei TaxID=396016 RepID=UPI003894BC73
MNIAYSSETLIAEFYRSVDLIPHIGQQRLLQLERTLSKVSDEIIVDSLVYITNNTDRNLPYTDQFYFCRLISLRSPKTTRNLSPLMESLIANWDPSVYELVKWIRQQFSESEIKITLAYLEQKITTKNTLTKLATFNRWLAIP